MFSRFRSRIGGAWCSLTHESVMWPVHGYYECRACGRRYPAFWEASIEHRTKPAAWKPVVLLVVAMALAAFAHSANAAELSKGRAGEEAEAALERYFAISGTDAWSTESVEIHASLPRLEKTGWLKAIRGLAPAGKSGYKVLQSAGDRTVEAQVILRYLNAEKQESELPAGSVAITPANYKFAYKGTVNDGERPASYIFQITPRRKRSGLMKGELWLDRRTGAPVLQSGRLVKSPSVLISRVSFTRENALCDGVVEARLTHITVDTRLVGRAELVVEERPLSSVEALQLAGSYEQGGQE